MLIRFMVKLAAEQLRHIDDKSNATLSRAGVTLSVDNSVIDRFGKIIRCTYSWLSSRWKKVVNGNDLLGIVLYSKWNSYSFKFTFLFKTGALKHR